MTDAPKYILHSTKDNYQPREDDDGNIISDGAVGRITANNVYLTGYASYPDDRRPTDLAVGECIHSVVYSLSGSTGIYSIYRVS